tara:strand:+ start:3835 stop:3960 length:126 start_codon:yes stop_codon:yes gene_type:complete
MQNLPVSEILLSEAIAHIPEVLFLEHYQSHSAPALYPSPFE